MFMNIINDMYNYVKNYDGEELEIDSDVLENTIPTYDGITPDEAKQFAQSDSKGRWALSHLWNKPYK